MMMSGPLLALIQNWQCNIHTCFPIIHLSVIYSVHRGVCFSAWWDTTPRSRPPWEQTSQEQTPPKEQTPPRVDTPRKHTPQEQTPLPWEQTPRRSSHPPWKQTPAYGLRVAGTHPTGMHFVSNVIGWCHIQKRTLQEINRNSTKHAPVFLRLITV